MQNKKFKFLILLAILIGISCADEPLPFDTSEQDDNRVYPRITSIIDNDFLLADPENSTFKFDVEYYSANDGSEFTSHEWFVRHKRDSFITDSVLLVSVSSSEFGVNATSGLPSASYTFSLLEVIDSLEMTIDDLEEADEFIFDGFITLNDGRVIGPDDEEASVQDGVEIDGIFRFVKSIKCVSELDGTYSAKSVLTNQMAEKDWDSCEGNEWEGKLKFESICDDELIVSSITEIITGQDTSIVELFDMSMGAYYACYGTTAQGSMPNGELAPTSPTLKFFFRNDILSYSGESQWGETYSVDSIGMDGLDLTIKWENIDGEGAITTITREDGEWPDISK